MIVDYTCDLDDTDNGFMDAVIRESLIGGVIILALAVAAVLFIRWMLC